MAEARPARLVAVASLALVLGACATQAPRYYAEDGPPAQVPAGLAATPDAVPRVEPLVARANRPYVALGRTYVPDTSDSPYRQRGVASWYGRQFHGNRTSSGEAYDMFAMTAAHPTLPIPSYARVSNPANGRQVIVRINDRGPFLHERIIDLSFAAATRLGLAGPGSGEVVVERITNQEILAGSGRPAPQASAPVDVAASAAPALATGAMIPAGNASAAGASAARPAAFTAAAAGAADSAPGAVGALPGTEVAMSGTVDAVPGALAAAPGAVELPAAVATPAAAAAPPRPSGGPDGHSWSVQVGAFANPALAQALRERIALLLAQADQQDFPAPMRAVRVESDGRLHRVLIGASADRASAYRWAQLLELFLARETALYAR